MLRGRDNWKENSNAFFFVNLKKPKGLLHEQKLRKWAKREEQYNFYLIGRNCVYISENVFSCFGRQQFFF